MTLLISRRGGRPWSIFEILAMVSAVSLSGGVLSSCQPIRFGGSHALTASLTLAADELAEVRHFSLFGQTPVEGIRVWSEFEAYATVCRADAPIALGESLGVLRLVPDSPSFETAMAVIAGDEPCVILAIGMYECPAPPGSPSGAECGLTIEVERGEGAEPLHLEVSVEMWGSVRGDGDAPSGFVSGLREDA